MHTYIHNYSQLENCPLTLNLLPIPPWKVYGHHMFEKHWYASRNSETLWTHMRLVSSPESTWSKQYTNLFKTIHYNSRIIFHVLVQGNNHVAPSGLTTDNTRSTDLNPPYFSCLQTWSEYHCWNCLLRNSFSDLFTVTCSGCSLSVQLTGIITMRIQLLSSNDNIISVHWALNGHKLQAQDDHLVVKAQTSFAQHKEGGLS